jgi:hypothetical protein
MSEQGRTWSNLSDAAFTKIQDLEALFATNKETIDALQGSIDLHTLGLEKLTGETLLPIKEQFDYIIDSHSNSRKKLMDYNINAKLFLDVLRETEDQKTLELIEYLLKLVAFK